MKKKTKILVQLEAAVRGVGEMLEADQALTDQEEQRVTSLSRHLLAAVHGWKRRAGRTASQSSDQRKPTQGRPGVSAPQSFGFNKPSGDTTSEGSP